MVRQLGYLGYSWQGGAKERSNMREKARIKRICKLLEKLWNETPDQRLGQLLENYIFTGPAMMFHQEDDITEHRLKEL